MKMLTRETARVQVKRMLANPMLTPQSDDGTREVIDCLLRHCDSPEHAERTMTAFLDGARDPRNLTAELAACAAQTREGETLPRGCEQCRYEVDGMVLYRSHLYGTRNGYDVALRCRCARGRYLAAADRRRDEELRERHPAGVC